MLVAGGRPRDRPQSGGIGRSYSGRSPAFRHFSSASTPRWIVTSGPKSKPALNAFATTFGDQFPAAETYQPNRRNTVGARQTRGGGIGFVWTSDRPYQGHLCSSNIELAARSWA
jgi:hypothetical protein